MHNCSSHSVANNRPGGTFSFCGEKFTLSSVLRTYLTFFWLQAAHTASATVHHPTHFSPSSLTVVISYHFYTLLSRSPGLLQTAFFPLFFTVHVD